MSKEIDDTLHFEEEDLDFLQPADKFQVDEQFFYAGRKEGSFLVFITGPDRGNAIGLHKNKMILGRGRSCDIVINKQYVSKQHAEIAFSNDKAILTDYGSTNGTRVNDEPVVRTELRDKDEIKIGHVILQYFHIDLNTEKDQTPPTAGDQKETEFYRQVFHELKPHFGQMTGRFLNRQISAHVGKDPYTIQASDKQELAKWINISVGLLLDEKVADALAERIRLIE